MRTIKINHELHGRRANRYRAGPTTVFLLVGERQTLTLGDFEGVGGNTIGQGGGGVPPVLVLGSGEGAGGLRVVEYALGGDERATPMQRNGHSRAALDRNSRYLDNKWSDGEEGFGEHGKGKPGRANGETLRN